MASTTVSAPPTPVRPAGGRSPAWLPSMAAAAVSVGAVVLGVGAWRDPQTSALTRPDGPIAASLVAPQLLAVSVTVAGVVGLVGVLGALFGGARAGSRPRRALVGLLAVEVVVLGFGLGSVSSIALAGYLVAMALPVLLVVLLIQTLRRYRRVRWAALPAAALFLAWGLVSTALAPDTLARLGSGLVMGFGTAGPRLLVAVLSTAAAAAFGSLLLAEVRDTHTWRRVGAYVVRHRTRWTVVAACCALPYGLVRMTWLTPWPVLGQSEALSPEIRLWGLLLGGGAILGFVLTLGLVRPWGERFPRWMPGVAGRPVSVAAAAVPGGIVAAVLCSSAVPMLHDLSLSGAGSGLGVDSVVEAVAMALVFPFWLWGPMLALAVWGYAARIPTTARS